MRTGTLLAPHRKGLAFVAFISFAAANPGAQNAALPPPPAPLALPKPGPQTSAPYAPTAILPGGVVIPIYPAGSRFPQQRPRSRARTSGRVLRVIDHCTRNA